MRSREDELDSFKTQIDLVAFAETYGYQIDHRRTSRTSVAMRHEVNGDRILVALNGNGHHIYASVHDHTDHGSIIDFVQKRSGGTLGHVRKELRSVLGMELARKPRGHADIRPRLEAVKLDFEAVRAAYDRMPPIETEHPYLTGTRCVPAATYLHPRFAGRLRMDDRSNVIFPHVQTGGELTGWESKNEGWTSFAKGGAKRLWCSGFGANDTHLVVCESGIDALSYATLFGIERRRFVSTGGALNPEQIALLRSAIQKLRADNVVVVAVDADKGGDDLSEQLTELHSADGGHVTFQRHSPSSPGQDWNDVLRQNVRAGSAAPSPPEA